MGPSEIVVEKVNLGAIMIEWDFIKHILNFCVYPGLLLEFPWLFHV